MAVYINGQDEGVALVKKGNEYVISYHEFIVAKRIHIPNLPTGENISLGSVAFCIETNQYFMYNGEEWVVPGE